VCVCVCVRDGEQQEGGGDGDGGKWSQGGSAARRPAVKLPPGLWEALECG